MQSINRVGGIRGVFLIFKCSLSDKRVAIFSISLGSDHACFIEEMQTAGIESADFCKECILTVNIWTFS